MSRPPGVLKYGTQLRLISLGVSSPTASSFSACATLRVDFASCVCSLSDQRIKADTRLQHEQGYGIRAAQLNINLLGISVAAIVIPVAFHVAIEYSAVDTIGSAVSSSRTSRQKPTN